MRSGPALLSWILILGVTACSAPSGGASSPPAVEPSLPGIGSTSTPSAAPGDSSAEPQTGWEWESETADDQAPADEETGPADGPVDGEPLGDAATDDSPDVALEESEAEEAVDPCSVVTTEEWSDWSGGGAIPAPQSLEDGDACGWIAAGDELRMAIGLFLAAGDERWLTADDIALATPVPGIGDDAWWLESWPVAQSSTLVVAIGQLDLVIEMSALTADHERLLEGALHFAALVVVRIT